MPDLAELGFVRQPPEKIAAPGGLDIAFSVYEKTTEPRIGARAEVRVYASESAARQDYPTQALGWRNPPPQVFGADLGNMTSPPLQSVPEATAYRATRTDPSGNRIWTDIFRVGRVVVVSHVLARNEEDAAPVRAALAAAVLQAVE
jgi:hypothetical protein